MTKSGQIEKVFIVNCGGLSDRSNCIGEDLLSPARLGGIMRQEMAATALKRVGWVFDKQRGWLCPKCVKSRALTLAKAEKKRAAV